MRHRHRECDPELSALCLLICIGAIKTEPEFLSTPAADIGLMAEVGLAELLTLGGDGAIIATFLLSLYFSLKEIRRLRIDLESKVLNDLNEQIHGMGEMLLERPELVRLLNKKIVEPKPEIVF